MKFIEDRQDALALLRDAIDIISPEDPAMEVLRQELYWLLTGCIEPEDQ